MKKYIIKLRVVHPYKHFEIEDINFHRAMIQAEELAEKEGMIFEDIKPVHPGEEYDFTIHKLTNLNEL